MGHRTKPFGVQIDVKLNSVRVWHVCVRAVAVHLPLTGPHNRFIISPLKRQEKD